MPYVAAQDSSDGVAKVIYQSKDAKTTKTFDALEWLAQLVTHIPNKGESAGGVRYGVYSPGGASTQISCVDCEKRPAPMIKFRRSSNLRLRPKSSAKIGLG